MATSVGDPVDDNPIEPYVRGAVQLLPRPDGLVQPLRFYDKQMETLERIGRSKRAVATAGVVLDLVTDGDEVSFDCVVTRHLDEGNPTYAAVMGGEGAIGRAEGGSVDGIDVVVAGRDAYTVVAEDGRIALGFDNPAHETVEVRVYLPCIMSVAVGGLATNGSLGPAPRRGYLLALGDSISQGFVVGCPSLAYPAVVSSLLGLDLLNQSVAGHVFDKSTLRGMTPLRHFPPEAIVVAYGTNDWARKESARAIERDAWDYLEKLEWRFPDVPTYVLSPLWRSDEGEAVPCARPLAWVGELLEGLCEPYGNMRFVDGRAIVPEDPLVYADGRLHPGPVGASLVADRLLETMRADGLGGDATRRQAPGSVIGGRVGPGEGPIDVADAQTLARPGAPGDHQGFDQLVRTIWRLRQPDGCPWDRAQTHASISRNMIEEAYEAVDAMGGGSDAHLREELGDVLMQVLLHAQIAADEGTFDIDDVVRDLDEKLVRRHPHVFGGHAEASSADEVLGIWDEAKRAERERGGAEPGLLDSIPSSLPALMQCQKISRRAAACGFEWETTDDVWAKVDEERGEFSAEERGSAEAALELGDVLFALVNVARKEGIDAEVALRASNAKFRRRWARVEALAREGGEAAEDLPTERLNALWDRAKGEELARGGESGE